MDHRKFGFVDDGGPGGRRVDSEWSAGHARSSFSFEALACLPLGQVPGGENIQIIDTLCRFLRNQAFNELSIALLDLYLTVVENKLGVWGRTVNTGRMCI
jgi:hypothetical protein